MSDITFEPETATFEDFMNSQPDLSDTGVEQAELDTLIAELAQDFPVTADVDTTQPEIDPDALQAWLDGLEPESPDLDL